MIPQVPQIEEMCCYSVRIDQTQVSPELLHEFSPLGVSTDGHLMKDAIRCPYRSFSKDVYLSLFYIHLSMPTEKSMLRLLQGRDSLPP